MPEDPFGLVDFGMGQSQSQNLNQDQGQNQDPQIAQDEINALLLDSVAAQNQREASVRAEATMIEVGTRQRPPGRIIFQKNVEIKEGPNGRIIIPKSPSEEKPITLNEQRISQQLASGNRQPFDFDSEISKLQISQDPDEKEQLATMLFRNLGNELANRQTEIRKLAAQRSGVNNAEVALQASLQVDSQAIARGIMRPTDQSIQTINAQRVHQAALTAANALEKDLIESDPDLRRIADNRAIITREMASIERMQTRRQADIDKLPFALNDQRLVNAKYALGLSETDIKKLEPAVARHALRDKNLIKVLDADKTSIPALLVNEAPEVRRYAYNILKEHEKRIQGLTSDDQLPRYIKDYEPLIANREILLTEDDRRELRRHDSPYMRETTAAGKAKALDNFLYTKIAQRIETKGRQAFQNMTAWQFTNPQFKAVIDEVKSTLNTNAILTTDGIDAIIAAKIQNPDGSEMSHEEKINELQKSADMFLKNQPKSMIMPDAVVYGPLLQTQVRNEAHKAILRQTFISMVPSFTGDIQTPVPWMTPFWNVPKDETWPANPRSQTNTDASPTQRAKPDIETNPKYKGTLHSSSIMAETLGATARQVPLNTTDAREIARNYDKAYRQGFKFGNKRLPPEEMLRWAEEARLAREYLKDQGLSW